MTSREVEAQRAAFAAWLIERAPDECITFTETHTSILAFQADRAFKLKKAAQLPFVDLSTLELRRKNCERELQLNRRFSPDVYLGVVEVGGEPIIEMRRLPVERKLSELTGYDATRCAGCVADQLAAVHAGAERGPMIDSVATRDGIAALWEGELAQTEEYVGTILDASTEEAIGMFARRYLDGRTPLFEYRIAAGRIVDGHGDLLADDVFCLEDGPRILDCLEFDDRLRWGDGLADAAFLAMDLERLGQSEVARRFMSRYREVAGENAPSSLEHFYIAHRAHVRAKVACIRHTQSRDARDRDVARDLSALALRHLDNGRVRIALVGGAPGTGKTTVARAICAATGWQLLRSDVVRKELAGLPGSASSRAPVDEGLYAPQNVAKTYKTMIERAASVAALGESVVLDASWADTQWRDTARHAAESVSASLDALRCDAPVEIAVERTNERHGDASDAGPDVARAIAARFDAWPEATTIDNQGPIDDAIRAALVALGLSPAPN